MIPPGDVELWYRDAVSCLQATLATVLLHAGRDALDALGLHWEFRYVPGDVRTEEFYVPCGVPGDPAASLMPHHPVRSRWQAVDAGQEPLAALAERLADGAPVIAAVDNFHLPFRPAFGDVHAAHLVVVYGVDPAERTVLVSDAMPPAFQGAVPAADFLAAWSSANPEDTQDAFFSDARIDRRYLDVRLGRAWPEVDTALLHTAIRHSVDTFTGRCGEDTPGLTGFAGLEAFLTQLRERAEAGDERALREAYPFGWGMQAQAALHGELLRRCGQRAELPPVREAGRLVESVAHAWTGVRVGAAHGLGDPRAAVPELARHASGLRRAYQEAVAGLDDALEVL